MTADDALRRRLIARLEHALQQPDALERLVNRLPATNASDGLKVWGAMRGLYPDRSPSAETTAPEVSHDAV